MAEDFVIPLITSSLRKAGGGTTDSLVVILEPSLFSTLGIGGQITLQGLRYRVRLVVMLDSCCAIARHGCKCHSLRQHQPSQRLLMKFTYLVEAECS